MSRFLAWLVAILGVATAAAEPLPASDSWWLLASGRYLAQGGSLRGGDPFSFTGGAWLNHEWLFGWGAYELHQAAGWTGLYGARTLCLVVAFAVLPLVAVRKSPEGTWATALLAAGYAWLFRSFYDVRPYLATYLLTALCLLCVRAYLDRPRRGWLVAVVVSTALWANLHGAFILGPGMLLVAALGCWLEKRLRPAAELGLAGLLALAAALCNPYGWQLLAFPFSLFGRSAFRLGLNEWVRPSLLGQHAAYWLVVCLGLLAARRWWSQGQKAQALLTVVFLLGGALAWRNLPLACLAGVQLHAVALHAPPRARWLTLALALGALGVALPRLERPPRELGLWDVLFPAEAVGFLEANPGLPHRLSNPYEWGGWLTWHLPGWKIFVDGRAHTVYSEQVYLDSMAIQFGGPWQKLAGASWEELLRRYQVDLVLVSRLQGDLEQRLADSSEFDRIYQDGRASVYLRHGVEHPPLAYPESSQLDLAEGLQQVQAGDWAGAADRFARAVQLAPGDPVPHLYLGVASLRLNRDQEGEGELLTALRLQPNLPDAHFNLGSLYRKRGDQARARAEFEAELRVNPEHAEARRALQQP